MRQEGLSGFLVPRADAHQGEWVAARDERLAWLTGFTGSAGFCAALLETAGVFVDGRYRVQVRSEVDTGHFTPVAWPETELGPWLRQQLPSGGVVGYDPWLHGSEQIDKLTTLLTDSGVVLRPCDNLIDRIWPDQPAPPAGAIRPHPVEFAGEASHDKRQRIGAVLKAGNQNATVLSLPDSIAWLLNIRGSDIARTPVVLAFAIVDQNGDVSLFTEPSKADHQVRQHLGKGVAILPMAEFGPALDRLNGPVRLDGATAPLWIIDRLKAAGIAISLQPDPCILPKAIKNSVEIEGARQAHLRDGVAITELLAWLDAVAATADLTEIDVVKRLEALRSTSGLLVDISFDTICGTGPNGAIVHYHVTEASNRPIRKGDILLLDSGGQYRDGTTDITRTIAIGRQPRPEQKRCFTRVLKGFIAISMMRWPKGLAGRDLDALARYALWQAGQDYDHGTGHGVGAFLGVHEGPQRLSRLSHVPFEAGMILSNEPGYYREGAFGIRIENLLVVKPAPPLPDGDDRAMLAFETLTLAPIDRNLIVKSMLGQAERHWLNRYHAVVHEKIAPDCTSETREWLARACTPI